MVVDLSRSVLALALAGLVATGLRTPGIESIFYGVVLLAMSLNRFLLAALSASLPHTIDAEEYMVANAVVPTVGPAGILIGAGVGTTLRLLLGRIMPDYSANAILFAVAAAGFVLSACLALRIPRHRLGPDDATPPHARDVVAGLAEALAHLRQERAAAIGLLTIGGHRIIYGIVTVATILVYRNYFHTLDQVEAAIADLGLLVAITGAGFVFAAVVTPPLSARFGVRAWMIICLVASAIFQILPGAFYTKLTLGIAAFLLGLTAQNIKICVDTVVQAHVADEFKGRVFVIYDMIFNVALVLAAGIGAIILPVNGVSVPILVVLAVGYLLVAVLFAASSRGVSMDEGTESLQPNAVDVKRATHARPSPLTCGRTRLGAVGPPGQQLLAGPVGAERTVLDPALQEIVVRQTDIPPRRDAQQLHDLVAVQVRAQRAQLLLLGQFADPPLQIVVRGTQLRRPGPVPGGAIGPGQDVQPGQLRSGIADVPADCRVPPLARPRRDGRRSRGTAGAARSACSPPRSRRRRTAKRPGASGRAWLRPRRDGGTTPCRPARTSGSPACRCRAAARPAW